jgi:hypothetical protein
VLTGIHNAIPVAFEEQRRSASSIAIIEDNKANIINHGSFYNNRSPSQLEMFSISDKRM